MSHYVGDVFLWSSMWDGSGISGCLKCDGSTYNVDDYEALYVVLGYQGSVVVDSTATTFETPDLRASAPEGLTPYIVAMGDFPKPTNLPHYRIVTEPYLGEVDYTTNSYPDAGWAFCDGSLLSTSQNTALFSILGNRFGGDGQKTFALPNVSDAVIAITGAYPMRG